MTSNLINYPNGDVYDWDTAIMYYADGTQGYVVDPPAIQMPSSIDYAGPSLDDPALQGQAVSAADDAWNLKDFTDGLLKIGMTAAQLYTLYQNVESSRQLTPAALQNLQTERQYLMQQQTTQNNMWLWAAIGIGALVVISRR